MRRIFKNTTAIAACLALLAPQMVAAQAAADAEGNVVPPAAEATPEVTPPEADASTEAPVAEVVPEAGAEAEAATEQPAAEAEAMTAEPTATEAETTTDAPAAEDDTALQDAMEAEAEPVATPEKTATPEASDLEAAMEAEQTDAVDPAAAEAPEAEAEPATDAQATEAPADAPVEPAAEADMTAEPVEDATSEAEAAPAEAEAETEATDLDAAMAAEQDAEADTTTEAPAAGADAAADNEAAATEEAPATDAPAADAAATDAPAADAQAQPAAAEDAAKATQVPNVAALDDNATSEVTEEEVTEENSRSSSEDFATTMQEATSTEKQDADKDDSDDGNDLTKAVLLGLGGVAVGAMLNNNRQVQLSTPDRVVVTRPDGTQELIKDDVALLRQPGSTVATENFDDGSSRTVVTRQDGSRVVTIRDADLRVLRRTLVSADGTQTLLIDETSAVDPVDIASLPAAAPAIENAGGDMDEESLREALMREADVDRRFSLAQIRDISQVRSLVAPIDVNGITFETNSAAIDADQAKKLTALGNVIRGAIEENPNEIFLIEGHTDTVGEDAANLALSDRRAELVALALTEYFQVAPENMVVQGYGEQSPKVAQEGDVRENRRVAVRRITGLLQTAAN
ncbi:OmpA family protein [Paracoccus sp. R86501]|uniref:OmpA family protein n=1 Tax=Paracoccus sp. R86501 TaxID=3101711 RepID=UPI00366FBAED